ncbi:asparagine synthase-related protein [Actinomadura sp. NTSP31]|uniref:asparagine synthase-related protein n=1 Tax=Actinomadura sp. NTSP31 TaxID=1735447 RepID=UPI0035C19AF1
MIGPLAEALVDAAAPLGRHPEPVELVLSGGRDSRLMAAVLKAAGVPFTGATHGFADDPDVVLARRVAEELGIEHHVDLTVPEGHKESVTVRADARHRADVRGDELGVRERQQVPAFRSGAEDVRVRR